MRRNKIYVAPSANHKQGYPNRYFIYLKEALADFFDVLEQDNRPCLMQGWAMLKNSFRADVFLLSFVETIAFHKLAFLQFLMAGLAMRIMKIRKRRIVFIFHNPKPHKGENWMSKSLTMSQFRLSCAVISHSKEAALIARKEIASMDADPSKVHYVCHPVAVDPGIVSESSGKGEEVLIWGNIFPYKGVLEFVRSRAVKDAGLKVRILGSCKDTALASAIQSAIADPSKTVFHFENRSADFHELSSLIPSSKCVLFPYLSGSVSSSGVLIDTVVMGGNPVGPSIGAFKDLAEEGVCSVYRSEDEMLEMLRKGTVISPDERRRFIDDNSWSSFAAFVMRLSSLA